MNHEQVARDIAARLKAQEVVRDLKASCSHEALLDVLKELALSYLLFVFEKQGGRAAVDALLRERLNPLLVRGIREKSISLVWSRPNVTGAA